MFLPTGYGYVNGSRKERYFRSPLVWIEDERRFIYYWDSCFHSRPREIEQINHTVFFNPGEIKFIPVLHAAPYFLLFGSIAKCKKRFLVTCPLYENTAIIYYSYCNGILTQVQIILLSKDTCSREERKTVAFSALFSNEWKSISLVEGVRVEGGDTIEIETTGTYFLLLTLKYRWKAEGRIKISQQNDFVILHDSLLVQSDVLDRTYFPSPSNKSELIHLKKGDRLTFSVSPLGPELPEMTIRLFLL